MAFTPRWQVAIGRHNMTNSSEGRVSSPTASVPARPESDTSTSWFVPPHRRSLCRGPFVVDCGASGLHCLSSGAGSFGYASSCRGCRSPIAHCPPVRRSFVRVCEIPGPRWRRSPSGPIGIFARFGAILLRCEHWKPFYESSSLMGQTSNR
jgi:hypothetical protein